MAPTKINKPVLKRRSKLHVRLHLAITARTQRAENHNSGTASCYNLVEQGTQEQAAGSGQDVLFSAYKDQSIGDATESEILCANTGFEDEEADDPIVNIGSGKKETVEIPGLLSETTVNSDGWKMEEICALLLLLAKKSGIADIVFGRFLRIIALLVNIPRHTEDAGILFPSSVYRLRSLLKINPSSVQEIVYICPGTSLVKLKAGKTEKEMERCGFRLRPGPTPRSYVCEVCNREWDLKFLQKDGNHFATVPVHTILTRMMAQLGRYTSSEELTGESDQPIVMNDVTDGLRYRKMDVSRKDLVILAHSDGAAISKSTNKKLYLTYVQCINIPLEIRLPVWVLQQVWVGEDLPKDRECFLKEFSSQLQKTQFGNQGFMPVVWTDSQGVVVASSVWVHSYLCDTPERAALNGQLSHSAAQGCVYCLQIAEAIRGRLCYRYDPTAELKTHEMMEEMAEQYEVTDPARRAEMLKQRKTKGFKRPSLIRHWEKFDLIEGFCIDVMHMFDEGVSRYFLQQLVEKDSVINAATTPGQHRSNLKRMNRIWLTIRVTGHNNRDLRSIYSYPTWKAHEMRFFIQHGLPYVTKDLVPPAVYEVLCLASRIAYSCTKDSISVEDVTRLKRLCGKFMKFFEDAFGVPEMKYSIHLVSHIWFAVQLYGPLHIVSCYGPEDQIGKTSRKILSMNNTTKHIMNNAVTMSDCTLLLETIRLCPSKTDYRVLGEIRSALGLRSGVFVKSNQDGSCSMLGKTTPLVNKNSYEKICALLPDHVFAIEQLFVFYRAQVETGIFVRGNEKSGSSCRNESIVMDKSGIVVNVQYLLALVDKSYSRILGTYVCGFEMEKENALEFVGTETVRVRHIFLVNLTDKFYLNSTCNLVKQLVVLRKIDGTTLLVSPPSNQFRPT